jgi:hypothetical protein
MRTTTLDVSQWLICTAVALSIAVAAEIRKAVLRRAATHPCRRSGSPAPARYPASGPFPAAGRGRWPGAASCRFSWTPVLTSSFIIADSVLQD